MPDGPRPQPPAGTCRVQVAGTVATHPWANIFWARLTAAVPTQADLQLLATKIGQSWGNHITAMLDGATIQNEVLLVWTPTAGSEIFAQDTVAHPGLVTTQGIQNSSSCYVVNHRTGAYYRGGHSRSMVAGVPEDYVTDASDLRETDREAMRSAWSSFVDAVQTGPAGGITGTQLGTVRFVSRGAWMNPPVFIPWQSHSVRAKLGTVKNRLNH